MEEPEEFSAEYWYSVQVKMGGTWITEKTRMDSIEEAREIAEWLKANKANGPRVRVNTHVTYREEV